MYHFNSLVDIQIDENLSKRSEHTTSYPYYKKNESTKWN